MIEVKNLSKEIQGSRILSDVNVKIARKEIFGFIGPSGAGKSTLLRMFNRLETPTQGKLIVDGEPLYSMKQERLRALRNEISIIFQEFNLLTNKTVYDNIALPLVLSKLDKSKIRDKVDEVVELVGLHGKKQAYPSALSGGQKQRVAIARALVTTPKILLCDEATSALDTETTYSILSLIKSLKDKLQLTVVLITHELDVVKQICDKVGVLSDGKLIEQGGVLEVFTHPQSETTKRLLGEQTQKVLPEKIINHLSLKKSTIYPYPLIKMRFYGEVASQSIISQVAREFNIDINILQASIEMVGGQSIGHLHAQLSGTEENISRGLERLSSKNIEVEVIGYVPENVI